MKQTDNKIFARLHVVMFYSTTTPPKKKLQKELNILLISVIIRYFRTLEEVMLCHCCLTRSSLSYCCL